MVAKLTNVPTKQELHQAYVIERMCQRAIGEKYGCSGTAIGRLLRQYGIQSRHTGPLPGDAHPQWSGGIVVNKGYRYVYMPEHPRASRGHRKYVLEHRLVMEQHLGRYLTESEVVHHKNGDTLDNRIENLELHENNTEHLRATLKGKCPRWTEEGRKKILDGCRKKRTYYPPRDDVQKMYVDEFLSIEEVASRLGSSCYIIGRILQETGIPARKGSYKHRWPDRDTVAELYATRKVLDVVDALGCTVPALYSFLKRNKIPLRTKTRAERCA